MSFVFIFESFKRSMFSAYFAPIFKAPAYYVSDTESASHLGEKRLLNLLNLTLEDSFFFPALLFLRLPNISVSTNSCQM